MMIDAYNPNKNPRVNKDISNHIEQYLETHPDYDWSEDPYMNGVDITVYMDTRQEYWGDRARTAGLCEYCADIALDLQAYYDEHDRFRINKWDSSKVNWGNVLLDVAGIPLGMVGKGGLRFSPTGTKILTTLGFADTSASFASARADKDGYGQVLAGLGVFPVIGSVAAFVSLGRDLGKGNYSVDYVPPIPRINN